MTVLTDRQRIELAIPAYLLYALASMLGTFIPADPGKNEQAEAAVAELRENLRVACLEPLADLVPRKRQAVLRRLKRIAGDAMTNWSDRSKLGVMLMLWYLLKDLTDREILVLWEGSAMDRAVQVLLPMFEHGFEEQKQATAAQEQARELLDRLQGEGFYR